MSANGGAPTASLSPIYATFSCPRLQNTPVLAAAKMTQTGPENVASPTATSTPAASASTPESATGPVDAGSPNADLAKKKGEVDVLQNDEDTVKFFENMKDLLNMESNGASAAEIANVINGIISGYNSR